MPEVLIETLGLSKIFHRDSTEIRALEDITLKVFSGDFINLMGPSGSGKSTLLNIMAGIDKPSGGELRIQDFEVASMSDDELAEWRNQHVGFVFQHFNLIPVLTAFENVELLISSDQSVQEGATRTRRDRTQSRGTGGPDGALSSPTIRRTGAKGSNRSGDRHGSDFHTGRRAHRRSGRRVGQGGTGRPGSPKPGLWEDDHHGDPRSQSCRLRFDQALPGERPVVGGVGVVSPLIAGTSKRRRRNPNGVSTIRRQVRQSRERLDLLATCGQAPRRELDNSTIAPVLNLNFLPE